jgi:GNAT superfamily N-acetyltransferase
MGVTLELHGEVPAFEAAVRGLLEEREAENALMLGLLAGGHPATFMARASRDGKAVFAAYLGALSLIVTRGPDAAVDATVTRLAQLGLELPGVLGPPHETERLARAWSQRCGRSAELAFQQRIYQLTTVTFPGGGSGQMRAITPADVPLVSQWAHDFDREALPPEEHRTLAATREQMTVRMRQGELFGWELGGQLVAMAGLARPTTRTISVNSVFTPPDRRGQGFATALVAGISAEGLRRGKQLCVLYTDLANPTSNSIYQKVGYRPVCDALHFLFRLHLQG